jgi:hypothetical protein
MRLTQLTVAVFILVFSCHRSSSLDAGIAGMDGDVTLADASDGASEATTVDLENRTHDAVTVFVAFGADSAILPPNWPFCVSSSNLNCSFQVAGDKTFHLPLAGNYTNATFAFGGTVSCGNTKSEINVNNPRWYDTVDVSLVDGFSNAVAIEYKDPDSSVMLGPVRRSEGNERALGVFPLGCDICVARQNPPCGMTPGKTGCKTGPDQYHPDVACQYQGKTMTGTDAHIKIVYLGRPTPAN